MAHPDINTQFVPLGHENENVKSLQIDYIVNDVLKSMEEKGYNSVNQLIGYLLTGEPTYITGHNQARIKIQKIDRDVLMQVIVEKYVDYLSQKFDK